MQHTRLLIVVLATYLFLSVRALGDETTIVAEPLPTTVISQKNPSNRGHPQNVSSRGSQSSGFVNAGGVIGEIRIASLAETLPELASFLDELNAGVQAGTLASTEELIERCREFYTAEHMAKIESVIPGWSHMASFAEGKTLWHVNVAMVALLDLEEYRSLSLDQQTVLQWVVLLHDIAKEPVKGRDHRHAFRSAALAGRIMPQLGFPVTAAYQSDFPDWFELTDTATRFDEKHGLVIVDNRRLPAIDGGAKRIFAEPTRSAVASIALHQSITSLAAWPVKAPLRDEQVMAYVDDDVYRVLLTLTLADSGGWNLFDPQALKAMYEETRAVFRNLPRGTGR